MKTRPSMNQKVTAAHLKKQAYCYVRQSTMKQVLENTESTKRQYALRERAIALGWPIIHIVTIDSDQGETAASIADREGFQRLMTEVSLGRVGLVMGLEVSRLARNSADWARLLEICAITDTLILDEDGLYDPTHFNDRLLLNMKGTFSEIELHILKSRLRGGVLSKAMRGEYRTRLPVGLVYHHNGKVILDPDKQVQQTIHLFFDIFRRTGAAFATVKAFWNDDIPFPRRPPHGPNKGTLEWGKLTYGQAQSILKNPRYAGAYYYGHHRSRRNVDGSISYFKVPIEEWISLIKDAHPAYISWDEYEENLERIKKNAISYNNIDRTTPPREGPCLLQGIAICGKCGQRMTIRYKYRRQGRIDPVYLCQRSRIERGEANCQYIPGACVDAAIEELILESLTPLTLDVALDVQRELEARFHETDKLRKQQVERAQYEANLSRRRFMQVDPDNRLVADTLEGEWNKKLLELSKAQEDYKRQCLAESTRLGEEKQKKIRALTKDFPKLWKNPKTPAREKKRMIQLLIEDVTLIKGDEITAHVRFQGGACKTLKIPLPPKGCYHALTDPTVVKKIDELLNDHVPEEIARILNEGKYQTGTGRRFDSRLVGSIRANYGLKTRYARLRSAGKLTYKEMADLLNVTTGTIYSWKKKRLFKLYPYNDKNQCLFEHPGVTSPLMSKKRKFL